MSENAAQLVARDGQRVAVSAKCQAGVRLKLGADLWWWNGRAVFAVRDA
jgi:hypothetical protein